MVIAYEPVWAIGTGRNATPEQAPEAHAHIRSRLRHGSGPGRDHCHVIYGGSVKPDNVHAPIVHQDVDGALSAARASTSTASATSSCGVDSSRRVGGRRVGAQPSA